MSVRQDSATRIIDIARRVGVSKATVGNVLNHAGKDVIRVSAARREEILRVAHEMHYVPNRTAQTLAGRRSMRIGVLIDRYASAVLQGILCVIEDIAERSGYQVMVGQAHDNPISLARCYDHFMQHGVDGVICLAYEYPGLEETVSHYYQTMDKVVFLEAPYWDAPHIRIDYQSGTLAAMDHLLETGRRRIAIWQPPACDYRSCRNRLAAYRTRCAGEPMEIIASESSEVYEYIRSHAVDAVLADSDLMAASLAQCLLSHGVRIPEDLALIGNNNDPFSACYYPPLSTIDHETHQTGAALFSLLKELMEGHEPSPYDPIAMRLIIRESSMRT